MLRTSARALCGAVVCLTLAGIPAAEAARPSAAAKRESAERAARKACLAGDYTTAMSILSDLFVETKDPTYIYNQGRCFEQNGRYEEAILRFREYLRTATGLSPADQAATQKHIDDCEGLLARQNSPKVQPLPEEPVPPAAPPPPPPTVVQQPPAPAPAEIGAGLRTAGLIVAGAGGAALVTGLVLNLKANSTVDSYGDRGSYTASKESDRKTLVNLGWVGYGVGAACVATGAILYTLGLRARSSETSSVALVPLVERAAAGAAVQGAF